MKTFRLSAVVTCSIYTEVLANSLSEAIEIAESRGIRLDFVGSGASVRDDWLLEEADGEAENIQEIET